METRPGFSGAECGNFDPETQIMAIYCSKYNESKPTNCSKRKKDFVQFQTTRYKFGGCNLDDVSIWMMPNHTELDISHSGYANIDSLDLRNLIQVNASHNNLKKLPRMFYEQSELNYILSELDFSHNNMTQLNRISSAFSQLTNIFLSHNQIRFVYGYEFENLRNLNVIDLSNNHIQSVFGFFSNPNLALHLEHNNIIHLKTEPKSTFSKIICDWKYISHFAYDHALPLQRFTNSSIEGIFNTSRGIELHCHDLSFERIEEFTAGPNIEMDIFKCIGTSLKSLNLMGKKRHNNRTNTPLFDINLISHFENLNSLAITNHAPIVMSNASALTRLRNLNYFDISGNDMVNPQEIIQHLNSNVEHFVLSNNYIGKINGIFDRFANIGSLTLNNVSLEIRDFSIFYKHRNLWWLDISNNNLTNISISPSTGNFQQIRRFEARNCHIPIASYIIKLFGPKLWYLDLSGNNVGELDPSAFRSFDDLWGLLLDNANLTTFDLVEFTSNLKRLSLTNNNLKQINLAIFPASLYELNLDGNQLTEINGFQFFWIRFKIAHNQMTCEYLVDLMKNDKIWVALIGDYWMQANRNCSSKLI